MRRISALSFWLLSSFHFASSALASEIIPGCQGEGCSCFQEYRSSITKGAIGEQNIKTIRPFTLYKERSKNSKVLGKFEAGVSARPLKQELVIEDKGEYLVEVVKGDKVPLRKGDKLDTLISLGEGFLKGRQNGKWVEFDYENPKLKIVRETKISEWLSVNVNRIEGFTQDSPFEMCLE